MKGKLIKMVEGYTLSLTGNIDDLYAISNKELAEDHQLYNLSMKNCQAIENGYDLDELGLDYYKLVFGNTKSYKDGFQKCLELLGDKKFSEKDMIMVFAYGHQIGMNNVLSIQSNHSPQPIPMIDSDKLREEFIQSLKVPEWDVEIEMEFKDYDFNIETCIHHHINGCKDCYKEFLTPKLDSNGCLILKRI